MGEPLWLIAAICVFLIGNGIFSGTEIAVISARRSRIDALVAEGRRAAKRLKALQDDMDGFLATVQIGVTLMGTLAGVAGGYLASRYVEPALEVSAIGQYLPPAIIASILVGGGIVYFELIFGELVPKALALRFTDTMALIAATPLWWMSKLSKWLVSILTRSTHAVLWVLRVRDIHQRTFVSEEEIKYLVTQGRHQGVLDQTEEELIHSVFEFSETPVKKVMVPRPKIFALDANSPPGEVEHLIVEGGYTRIPVYDATPDNVIGLVYIKDVLRLLERRQPVVLRKILHPVHFVPETKKVGDLLKELQKRRTHMALVIDEHGSLAGLVTLEDLLEEIVGEIQDEYDWEERPIETMRDGSLVVDGTVSAADLRASHHVPIPESTEFETVAGFLLESLGTVPRGGEHVDLGGFRLTVVDVEGNRISKVKIDKAPVAALKR